MAPLVRDQPEMKPLNAVNAGYKNAKDDYKRVRDELQLADIIPVAETV